jgi:anthranilate synthase component 1
MSFLLESVEGGEVRGRYSIIGLDPDVIFRSHGAHAEINRTPQNNPEAFAAAGAPPLAALRALIAESRIALPDGLPPMAAGVFGYLGYDMVRQMEDSLAAPPPDSIGIPDAILIRPTLVIAFDAVKDTITVVTPVRPQAGVTAKAALARAVDRLSAVVDALDRPLHKSPPPFPPPLAREGRVGAGSSTKSAVKCKRDAGRKQEPRTNVRGSEQFKSTA